jgi:hypothetical protein
MDLLDRLALAGRRYTSRSSPRSGSNKLDLADVLVMFDGKAIHELSTYADGKPTRTVKPDEDRKLKVSLLDDGMSVLHAEPGGWYEVYETAPSGDLSKVKIQARSSDNRVTGELRMLIGRRTLAHYFEEDPILLEIEKRERLAGST